jgi:hypothetical protein
LRIIEQKLIEYNEKKQTLEVLKSRIEAYRYAKDHPEIRINEFPQHNPFAIKDSYNKGISIVEINTLSEEKIRELLEQEISDEESRANHLELLIKPYDIAIGNLTETECYIISNKLFSSEKFKWSDIELNYNKNFKKEKWYKYIPENTLRIMYYKTLDKLEKMV